MIVCDTSYGVLYVSYILMYKIDKKYFITYFTLNFETRETHCIN